MKLETIKKTAKYMETVESMIKHLEGITNSRDDCWMEHYHVYLNKEVCKKTKLFDIILETLNNEIKNCEVILENV